MTANPALRELLRGDAPALRGRKSLAEEAAGALRDLILLEKLAPGAPIPEQDVADALGISRTPMREAMRLLELEGLVEFTATRRARVANPSLDELAQYLVVLGALEALAGECACEQASAEEIETVSRLNDEMLASSDCAHALGFFRIDMAFHRAIVLASHNAPLIETHRHYNARLWRARFISSRRRLNREGTLRQHTEIAAAIAARDRAACARTLRGHLETAVVNIRQALAERNDARQPQS